MEADFNFENKFVFGHLALNKLLEEGYVPEEQYSQRESTAEDTKIDSRLTYVISRQLRQPMGYNPLHHVGMSPNDRRGWACGRQ